MTVVEDLAAAAELIDDLAAHPEDAGRIETSNDGEIAPTDVFTPPFVRQHTDASTFREFVEASPLDGTDGTGDVDAYVAAHSEFDSWEEMAAAAKAAWLERELGLL